MAEVKPTASTEVPAHIKEAAAKTAEAKQKVVDDVQKRTSGRPTPTQQELDEAALGHSTVTHEDDGSGPDPAAPSADTKTKQSEAKPATAGGYQTRQAQAPKTE
jgi:hypothetical protein